MKKFIAIWLAGLYISAALSGMFWILGTMAHLRYSFPLTLFVVSAYLTTIICIVIALVIYTSKKLEG